MGYLKFWTKENYMKNFKKAILLRTRMSIQQEQALAETLSKHFFIVFDKKDLLPVSNATKNNDTTLIYYGVIDKESTEALIHLILNNRKVIINVHDTGYTVFKNNSHFNEIENLCELIK